MSRKPETIFREKLVAWLEMLPNVVVFPIQQKAICGTPDLLCAIKGRFVAIEIKSSEDAIVDPLQEYNLGRIASRGKGIALIVSPEGYKKAQSMLSQLAEDSPPAPPGTLFC